MLEIQIENSSMNIRKLINTTIIMIKDKFLKMYKANLFQNLKILRFYYLQKKRILKINLLKILLIKLIFLSLNCKIAALYLDEDNTMNIKYLLLGQGRKL